jgi:NAD-dependent dihydropyrimidine dehydrogenase PreA subunit
MDTDLPVHRRRPRFDSEEAAMAAITIDQDTCEKTGVCSMVCPEDVFKHEDGRTEVVNPGSCTYCWLCVDNCTSGAIELD